jgi:glucan biosynthesis protein C
LKNPAETTTRLYYIDWLRVLAMLSIFLFHSDRFFNFDDWHVKNSVTNMASSIHVEIFDQWMMPLFFILSGAAVYYSLKSRKAGEFVKERTLRILVPVIILGWFIIAPPQVYLERLTHGEFTGTFFQFYPHYFSGIYGQGGNFAIVPMHMWYLVFLFVFSIILLPAFLPRRNTGNSLVARLARPFEKPWALLLLFIPLTVMPLLADVAGLSTTRQMGSWDILSYLLFFIYGYLIFSDTRIQHTIKKYSPFALVGAVIFTLAILALEWTSALYWWALRAICAWCWIIAILGFGSRFLNLNNRFLKYASEAVLPFYILHQTIILIIGFYVVQWDMRAAPKYFIIVALSFVGIMALYELLIRRVNVLRFLFGMKLQKKRVHTSDRR